MRDIYDTGVWLAVLVTIVASVNDPWNVTLHRLFLNDWVEVARRKVSGNEFHSRIVRGKKEDH